MPNGNFISTALFLALLGATFSFAARAADDDELVPLCPSLQELDTQMMSCEDNYYAAEKAEECAEKIKATWKTAAATLQAQLVTAAQNQSHSEKVAGDDYKKAISTLKAQIDYMQDATDLVASYPQVMINFPDSNGEEEASLSCFNEAFEAVQKTVTGLDDEIVKAIDVYDLAKNRKKVAGERQQGLDFSLVDGGLGGKHKAARVPSGQSENGASDVTGMKKEQGLASLNAQKVEKFRAGNEEAQASAGALSEITKKGSDVSESIAAASFADRLEARQVARGSVELDPVTGLPRAFARGNAAAQARRPSSAGSEASVGAILWKESGRSHFAESDFALAGSSAVTGVEPQAAVPNGDLISPANLRAAASADTDLFSLVRSRYRETELFRSSR